MSGSAPVNHSVGGGDGFEHLRVWNTYHEQELGSLAATAVECFALGGGTRTMESETTVTAPDRDASS